MPGAPKLKPVVGSLRLAVLLASVAGFLDAHLFQQVTPVFVANHSGNLIKLGMDVGAGRWNEAAISSCAIAAFVAGVGAVTLFMRHEQHRVAGRRMGLVLACESALLVTVFVATVGFDVTLTTDPGLVEYALIVVAAGAMGLQTATLSRVGTTSVSTTFGTGSLARVGQHSALGAIAALDDARSRHLRTARLLLSVIGAYVVGAALASALPHRPVTILVPATAVAAIAGLYLLGRRGAG